MKLECIKERYPSGTKVRLIEMIGEPQMESGIEGTVTMVDDIGQIHVSWSNGSSLALNQGTDVFEVIKEKMFTVLIVEPNSEPRVAQIPDTLAGMQEVVGGLIESFSPFEDDITIICNEEGKLKKLPQNRAIYVNGELIDIIVGTFFVCSISSEDGENVDLTTEQIAKYSKIFKI